MIHATCHFNCLTYDQNEINDSSRFELRRQRKKSYSNCKNEWIIQFFLFQIWSYSFCGILNCFFLLRLKTTFKMDISLYRYNASMMEYYSCIVFFFESISIIRFNHSIYWLLEWKIFISFLFYPLFSLSRPRRCQSAWRCFR